MRVRLIVQLFGFAALYACNPDPLIPALAAGGDSLVELHSFAPSGDRLATIEYVEGGGAGGYTGYRVRLAIRDHEWRTVAFVRARDVAIAWHGSQLAITGSFDVWDRSQNERTLNAADADGVTVRMP